MILKLRSTLKLLDSNIWLHDGSRKVVKAIMVLSGSGESDDLRLIGVKWSF